MTRFIGSLTLLSFLLSRCVLAHFTMQYVWVDGERQPWSKYIRMTTNNSPVTDVNSADMNCNDVGMSGVGIATKQVRPGANITFEWHQHINVTNELALSFGHKGPTGVMLAAIPSAVQPQEFVPSGPIWTKVYHDGLHFIDNNNPDGFWSTDVVQNQDGCHSITLPSCLPDGNYLIRAENVALDLATAMYGAQWYIGCVQVYVNSSLSTTKTRPNTAPWATRPLYSMPGLYHATDPGVLINIYWGMTNYTIPGPLPWTC